MINERNKQKSLIIVYDEKCKSYATHIMQLIGMQDDNDSGIVGVEDGSVKGVMWSENKFIENEVTITSDQQVLFIGQSKITKINNEHTIKKYSKYGIEYGWLGKRAVITVNKKIALKDYNKFVDEAKTTVKKIEEKKDDSKGEGFLASLTVANIFATYTALPIFRVGILLPIVLKGKKELEFQKIARDQRFKFAILKFYNDHLSEFVGK